MRFLSVLFTAALALAQVQVQPPSFMSQVQKASLAGDFTAANHLLETYKASKGITPEYIQALSWIGRGEVAKGKYDDAGANAAEVRKLVDTELAHRKLDAEPALPIALGASIEVRAQALAGSGARDQAVVLLQDELKRWGTTSIQMRLQKNLNLLTLEGKPAPEIDVSHWIGDVKPKPLSAYRGHPVLVFLWAHWCPDCKNEVAIIQQLRSAWGPRGLVVVAPTQHYGYVAKAEPAPPDVETKYITEVFHKFYEPLAGVDVPISESAFTRFGVSTTPTLLLIDKNGIVRMYNPGAMTLEALTGRLERTMSY